jgi:hypothetical protein
MEPRDPGMGDPRLDELQRRLERLEERGGQRQPGPRLIPDETRRHLQAAGREQLLAVRSLLDHWIDRLAGQVEPTDDTGTDPRQERQDHQRIPIE